MALTSIVPSVLRKDEFASVLGAPVSQVREWSSRGVIVPTERERGNAGAHLYGRDDLALGAVVLALQRVLGEKSRLVFDLAKQVKPHLRDWLRWGQRPTEPLTFLVADEGTAVLIVVKPEVFSEVLDRLEALA
jgi:hypothetical protein